MSVSTTPPASPPPRTAPPLGLCEVSEVSTETDLNKRGRIRPLLFHSGGALGRGDPKSLPRPAQTCPKPQPEDLRRSKLAALAVVFINIA